MGFTDGIFFVFLPLVLLAYFATRRWHWMSTTVLLVSSYIFYGYWDWRFCGLLLFSSLVDFVCGKQIHAAADLWHRRLFLWISIGTNLAVLGTFKYFNFFVDTFVVAVSSLGIDLSIDTIDVILPVGISFYTFQTMTYTIDIYRGQMQPSRSLLTYLTYVAFFPQLVAGPIERARHLLPQLERVRRFVPALAADGVRQIIAGLFKKVVIADNLAPYVDMVYARPEAYSTPELWLATWFFGLQIYCDFSGYSDIAIGLGKLFGVDIMQNFRTPYFASSIREFWRRWHISLSTFFRDYVYFPLGGNRVGRLFLLCNLMVVFLLSGLWHGASANYVIWGAWHGAGLVVATVWSWSSWAHGSFFGSAAAVWVWRLATTLFVTLGWVFFRAGDWSTTQYFFTQIFDIGSYMKFQPDILMTYAPAICAAAAILIADFSQRRHAHLLEVDRLSIAARGTLYLFFLFSILLFGMGSERAFIYFQF